MINLHQEDLTPDLLLTLTRGQEVTLMRRAMDLNAQGIVTYVRVCGIAIRPTYEAAKRFRELGR